MEKKWLWIVGSVILMAGLFIGSVNAQAPATSKPINLVYHFALTKGTNVEISWWWMDEVEKRTNKRVTFKRITGGSLSNASNQPLSLKDRVFDVGEISCVYSPGLYPYTGVSVLPFVTGSFKAMNYAQYDWLQTAAVQQEHAKLNTKGLMSWVLEPMEVMSHVRATTLEELKKLKTRAHGGGADALSAVGGVPVAIPWDELATAAERKVIDAAIVPVPIVARDNGLQSLFAYALRVPFYFFQWGLSMNLDTWKSLPADIQQIMLDVAKGSPAKNIEIFNAQMDGAWADLKKARVQEVTWSQAELKKLEELGGPVVHKKWVQDMNKLNLPGQKMLDDFRALLVKYGG